MKKIIYTLILSFFALNLSAKVYIVSNNSSLFNGSVYAETKVGSGLLATYENANITKITTNGSDYTYAYEVTNIKNAYLKISFANGQTYSSSNISDNSMYEVGINSSGNPVLNKISFETFSVAIEANDPYLHAAISFRQTYHSRSTSGNSFTYTFCKPLFKNGITVSVNALSLMRSNNTYLAGIGDEISISTNNNNDVTASLTATKSIASAEEQGAFPGLAYYYSIDNDKFFFIQNLSISKTANESKSIDPAYKSDSNFGSISYSTTYTTAQVANWLWIACPYDATLSVRTAHGIELKQTYTGDPNKNYTSPCFILKKFDSEKRAASRTDYWVEQKNATLTPGEGYILGIDPRSITDNIIVTYTSTSKLNTHTITYSAVYNPTSTISDYANQHLIGTKLFYPATFQNRSNAICMIATPQEKGFTYSVASNKWSKNIEPFSAYFIQFAGEFSIKESTSASYAPAARIKETELNEDGEPIATFEMYTLKIANNNSEQETTILMEEKGSEGYTLGEDFFYFTEDVDGIPFANQFYSLDQGEPRSFNHRKNENQTISLGGRIETAGEYTISLNAIDTKAKSVLLTDTYFGLTTELTLEDYTFTASENENIDNRFVITFSFAPEVPVDTYVPTANQIIVSGNAANCNINNLTVGETVMIFDATGRIVYNQTAQSENINITLISGTYIVRQNNKWAKFAIK